MLVLPRLPRLLAICHTVCDLAAHYPTQFSPSYLQVDIASVHTNDFEGELTLGPLETTGADYSSVMASLSALDLGAYTGSVPVATYSGEVGMATES